MNINLEDFFNSQEQTGYYWNEEKKCYTLKGVNCSIDKTRNNRAAEESKENPVLFNSVYCYINEFLEHIRADNGFPEKIIREDSIKFGEKEHKIIDNGIIINDNSWEDPHWDWKKRMYTTYDKKYDVIVEKFKLERPNDLLWFKFTKKGHLAVVASSCDINWKKNSSCGTLVREVGDEFDESFVFVFPLTQQMIRTKNNPKSYERKYTVSELERAVGNYLYSKGVPIIDYYSHMGWKFIGNFSIEK